MLFYIHKLDWHSKWTILAKKRSQYLKLFINWKNWKFTWTFLELTVTLCSLLEECSRTRLSHKYFGFWFESFDELSRLWRIDNSKNVCLQFQGERQKKSGEGDKEHYQNRLELKCMMKKTIHEKNSDSVSFKNQ